MCVALCIVMCNLLCMYVILGSTVDSERVLCVHVNRIGWVQKLVWAIYSMWCSARALWGCVCNICVISLFQTKNPCLIWNFFFSFLFCANMVTLILRYIKAWVRRGQSVITCAPYIPMRLVTIVIIAISLLYKVRRQLRWRWNRLDEGIYHTGEIFG